MAASSAICSAWVTPRETTTAIQTASLTSDIQPSSRFYRPPAVTEPAHAIDVDGDTEPMAIRHGDHVALVPRANVPNVLRQHQRTAHLDGSYIGHSDGRVQTCRRRYRALDHRADLRDDASCLGDGIEFQRVQDATGFHQLDIDQIGGTQRDGAQHVAGAMTAFVDHDDRPGLAADLGQSLQIPPQDWLLHIGGK